MMRSPTTNIMIPKTNDNGFLVKQVYPTQPPITILEEEMVEGEALPGMENVLIAIMSTQTYHHWNTMFDLFILKPTTPFAAIYVLKILVPNWSWENIYTHAIMSNTNESLKIIFHNFVCILRTFNDTYVMVIKFLVIFFKYSCSRM